MCFLVCLANACRNEYGGSGGSHLEYGEAEEIYTRDLVEDDLVGGN